jgi:hypothetical protein
MPPVLPPQSDLDYWDEADNRKFEYQRMRWANAMNRLDVLSKRLTEEQNQDVV